MKRHKSLIPLSQDHHNGLMLAQLIKNGAPNYKGLPVDIEGKINFVNKSWEKELKFHFQNEEKILFPAIIGKSQEIDNLVEDLKKEHEQIRILISKLSNQENREDILDKLGKLLEKHIRKEERVLFQKLQISFIDELKELENKISSQKKACNL